MRPSVAGIAGAYARSSELGLLPVFAIYYKQWLKLVPGQEARDVRNKDETKGGEEVTASINERAASRLEPAPCPCHQ